MKKEFQKELIKKTLRKKNHPKEDFETTTSHHSFHLTT